MVRFMKLSFALAMLPCLPISSLGHHGTGPDALANPLGHVKALYFENSTSFGLGPGEATANILNIKPIWPVSYGNWNFVNRVVLPVIYLEGQSNDVDPEKLEQARLRGIELGSGGELSLGRDDSFGLGNTTVQTFLARHKPGKLIWGLGPALTLPTHTDNQLGADKWSAGVACMLLAAPGRWVFSGVAQNVWSFAGSGTREINRFAFEYILNYKLGNGWFLASSPNITANWEAESGDRWTVPVGGGIGRVIKSRNFPATLKLEALANVAKPRFAPDWSIQVSLNFLFPNF